MTDVYCLKCEEEFIDEHFRKYFNIKILDSTEDAKVKILFIFKKENLINVTQSHVLHNLYEYGDIEFIVFDDTTILRELLEGYDKIIDVKVDEDWDRNMYRWFRITNKKYYKIVCGFKNYYYIEDDFGEFLTIDGKRARKIYGYNYKTELRTYEKDINISKRYCLDNTKSFKIGFNFRTAYFDIETNACVDAVDTPGEIISIVAQDSFTKDLKVWAVYPDKGNIVEQEKNMLGEFFDYIKEFDVLTGWNCLHEDTEIIIKDRGVKKIKDISIGDEVLTFDNYKSKYTIVRNKREVKSDDVIKFNMMKNGDLTCTGDHKLLVFSDGEYKFKKACDINYSDMLIEPSSFNIDSKYEFDNNICYLAGLIFADGHICKSNYIRIYNTRSVDEFLRKIYDRVLSYTDKLYIGKDYLKITDKKFTDIILSMGVAVGNRNINVSDFSKLLYSSEDNICNFIAGMYDGDGCDFSISMSKPGFEITKYLFKKLGIECNCRKLRDGRNSLYIYDRKSKRKFLDILEKYSLLDYRKNKAIYKYNEDKLDAVYDEEYKILPSYFTKKYMRMLSMENNSDYNKLCSLRRKLSYIPHCYNYDFKYSRSDYSKILYNMKILRDNTELLGADGLRIYNELAEELKLCESVIFVKIHKIEKITSNSSFVDIETENNVFIANKVVSHNCMKFDIPYVLNRAKLLGVDLKRATLNNSQISVKYKKDDMINPWYIKISGLNLIDMMAASVRALAYLDEKLKDNKLDTVAKAIVGEQKYVADTPAMLFSSNKIVELVEYNKQDVLLLMKIDNKLGIIDLLISTLEFVPGLNLEDSSYNSKIIDYYLLSKFNDIVYPSINRNNVPNIKGAIVLDPVTGIHDNVAVLDIAGMYPNLIITFNISPEMIIKVENSKSVKIDNVIFEGEMIGILPKLVDDFMGLRQKYKELKQQHENDPDYELYKLREFATKKILSSIFGVFGYSGFRLFSDDIANSITGSGKALLNFMKENAEKEGFVVVSGDTDSLFIKWDKNKLGFEEFNDVLNKKLDKFVRKFTKNKYFVDHHRLVIEYETLFKRIIIPPAKKKYIGVVSQVKGKKLEKLKLYYKGSELNKKDVPAAYKKIIREMLEMVLYNESTNTADVINELRLYGKKVKANMKNISFRDLLVYKEINRDFDAYKVKPQHVRAAENSNKLLGAEFSRMNYKGGILHVLRHGEETVLFLDSHWDFEKNNGGCTVNYYKYYESYFKNKIRLIFGDNIYNAVTRKDSSLLTWFKL